MASETETAKLPAGLYLVATPIGNLRDITLRAIDTLKAADLIACEDTRTSRKLLNAYSIRGALDSYNDHNADEKRPRLLAAIREGKSVALISDAGTPLVSDPGYRLVRDCVEQGLPVTALPGANAVLTALQLSGLPSDKFVFLGFLPPRGAARQAALAVWKDAPATLLLYEAPQRLAESLADAAAVLGTRQAAVCRELTKLFEEHRHGTLEELAAFYAETPARGEIVIAIAPGNADDAATDAVRIEDMLRQALRTMRVKDAAAAVSGATGLPKKQIYDMALRLQKELP